MAKRRGNKKEYIKGTFTLSSEHIELSRISGVSNEDLIEQYLQNIEIENQLKPMSLVIYHREVKKSYIKYWYTEERNANLLDEFDKIIFSIGKNFDPSLN